MNNNSPLAHDHSELDTAMADAATALAAEDLEESFQNLDVFWARLAMHIRAENVHLFPSLLEAAGKEELPAEIPALEAVQKIIAQLRLDHDFFMSELTAGVKQLRDLRRSDDQRGASEIMANVNRQLTGVRQRLDTHNELEESQVYHWTALLLTESEQKTLAENIDRELANLPPRLREK